MHVIAQLELYPQHVFTQHEPDGTQRNRVGGESAFALWVDAVKDAQKALLGDDHWNGYAVTKYAQETTEGPDRQHGLLLILMTEDDDHQLGDAEPIPGAPPFWNR